MAQITINLPDHDSPAGVTLETLEAHIKQRGSLTAEAFVNVLIADALGYRLKHSDEPTAFPGLAQLREDLKGDSMT